MPSAAGERQILPRHTNNTLTFISDEFKTDVYEYKINIKDIDMLDIEAIATKEDATIEILGNENLQEGENIITIIVKSKDEEQTVTYQIKATKLIVTEEPEPQEKTVSTKYIIYGAIAIVLTSALVIVVIYTIKHRKTDVYSEDEMNDDFEYYPEDLPEKDGEEYYPEDLPEKVERKSYFEEDFEEDEYISDEQQENRNNYFLEDPDEWDKYKKKDKRGKHF